MKYHPAKKEVEFRRFQNEKEVDIRNDSRLKHYMNLRGEFVLQDHGNEFFEEIANVFDGIREIEIQVITTKKDYEDFLQMVQVYNEEKSGKCKIHTVLQAELPDMKQTFIEVKEYGKKAIHILQQHKNNLFSIPLESDSVRKSAESFAQQINEEMKNIQDKIDSLGDNSVKLCFTGVYSAGKSALINAILGYQILPENIRSETAKMMKISSPKNGETVKIKFRICRIESELEWSERNGCFEFSKGPSENVVRTEIQKIMNDLKDKKASKYTQIEKILSDLNKRQEVSAEIEILFPVPLDNENVQFTIYDTPGSDSNYQEHQVILNEALKRQYESILIFVAKPDGLEGTGNKALLNYLKEAEEKDSKTSIDLSRSLFVINKADTQTSKNRHILQEEKIKNKNDEKFDIDLKNKKLFFTSAQYGYVAKAIKNGIATEEEQYFAKDRRLVDKESPYAFCYKENRCATSEYLTKKMMKNCELALKTAQEKNNTADILYICSGLYALEQEILLYGEKYASAVKVFAIINSVNRALEKLSRRAGSLKRSNQEDIKTIEYDIEELNKTISSKIDEVYNNTIIKDNELPDKIQEQLRLKADQLKEYIIAPIKNSIDNTVKAKFFNPSRAKAKKEHKEQIEDILIKNFDEFKKIFDENRRKMLERERNLFVEKIKYIIRTNGRLSESAKCYFCNITPPLVKTNERSIKIDEIYQSQTISRKFFSDLVKKKELEKEIEGELNKVIGEMRDEFIKDYKNNLKNLLIDTKSHFTVNLKNYSLDMKAMVEDRNTMKQLGKKISDAAEALANCQKELDTIIWRQDNDDFSIS